MLYLLNVCDYSVCGKPSLVYKEFNVCGVFVLTTVWLHYFKPIKRIRLEMNLTLLLFGK